MEEPGKANSDAYRCFKSLADGGSRYKFTEGCSLKIEAGQDSSIAPYSAFLTALAFLSSGTKQLMCCALIMVGMVSVRAVLGTISMLSNQPSSNCCLLQS